MVSAGCQSQLTVLVAADTVCRFCLCPRIQGDCQTCLARYPPYQPIRSAHTRNSRAVVDTYSVAGSPCSTLTWPVNPWIASGAPRCLIHQCGSPGSEFSAFELRSLISVARGAGLVPPAAAV